MIKYPMRLEPYPREMIWGSNRLKTKFGKEAPFEKLGESWELSVRPEAQSVIGNGVYAGKKLSDILECGYDFPLLIKFINSGDRLSVQVHPDDNITDKDGTPLGKTEMWYIIEAEDDAHIIYGLNSGVTKEVFTHLVRQGHFDEALRRVHVKAGECYFIPAGQVHAIGKGIVLCEIQQNSDTTYRLYDYGRIDKNCLPRTLHIDEGLGVARAFSDDEIEAIRYSDGYKEGCLANCDKFEVSLQIAPSILKTDNSFSAVIFIEGRGEIVHDGDIYAFKEGDTFYIPEDMTVEIKGSCKYLCAKAK